MPFFSIIIPTYNRSNYLIDAIQSIQKQFYADWECIVVDDGSIDDTAMIVQKMIESDSRIKYLYQTNAERSVARNNGIRHSEGSYICFLDSDDLFKSNHLEDLHTEIVNLGYPEGMFFVNHTTLTIENEEQTGTLTYDQSSDYFIKNSIIPARVCIARTIFDKYQFDPRIVIVEDSVLWTQISFYYKVIHLEKENVIYRWHDENSVNIKNNCFLPRLSGLKVLFNQDDIKNRISREKRNEALSNCYYGIAKHHFYKRNFLKMLYNISKSLLKDRKSIQNKSKIYMIYEYIR